MGKIRNMKRFAESLPANWDGFFGWDDLDECFPMTDKNGVVSYKSRPTDIDGVTERFRNFLVWETKFVYEDGTMAEVPVGQRIMLRALHDLGKFTIIILWCRKRMVPFGDGYQMPDKHEPVYWEVWRAGRPIPLDGPKPCTRDEVLALAREWWAYANRRPA